MLNVFFYRQTVTGALSGALGLFNAFQQDLLGHWAGTVVDNVNITEMEVFSIEFPTDFWAAIPPTSQGLRVIATASRVPTWLAYSMRSNRAGAGSRRSYKRFGGIGETDVVENSLASTFLALAAVVNFQAALSLPITEAAGATYEMVQVKSGWTLGFAPTVNFTILNFDPPVLSSQVSRKP